MWRSNQFARVPTLQLLGASTMIKQEKLSHLIGPLKLILFDYQILSSIEELEVVKCSVRLFGAAGRLDEGAQSGDGITASVSRAP